MNNKGKLQNLTFQFYFPTEDDPRKGTAWIRNPFLPIKDRITVSMEDKLIELSADEGLKMRFENTESLASFWIKAKVEYPDLADNAIKTLIPFPTTYLCEHGFSTMSIIKTKYRNLINIHSPFRLALSTIEPRLEKIISQKQAQSSH